MVDEIKVMLGDAAGNYTDAQIGLALKMAIAEVEDYCRRDLDSSLELIVERIAVIKLNRMGTEGLVGLGLGGVSESYIDGYPADILATMNAKRRILDTYRACVELYGEQKAFIHFRSDFARKFLSELYQKKTTLGTFEAIYAQITAA